MVSCTLSCGNVGGIFCARQPDILHMTLARVLKPPIGSGSGAAALQRAAAAMTAELCGTQTHLREIWCAAVCAQHCACLHFLHFMHLPPGVHAAHPPSESWLNHMLLQAVALYNTESTVPYIPTRYVEELDLLALALGGAFKQHSMPLQCRGGAA